MVKSLPCKFEALSLSSRPHINKQGVMALICNPTLRTQTGGFLELAGQPLRLLGDFFFLSVKSSVSKNKLDGSRGNDTWGCSVAIGVLLRFGLPCSDSDFTKSDYTCLPVTVWVSLQDVFIIQCQERTS